MTGQFLLTTTDSQRRAKWQRIFGVDELPVKADKPRWRVERGAFGREVNVLGYDLDASRVHWMGLTRFAEYVSRKTGHEYTAANMDGWLIRATGYETVHETADSASWQERPFSFLKDRVAYAI